MNWKEHKYDFEGLDKYLNRINSKKTQLDSLRPIHSYALQKLTESLSLEWTYNSNAIEGNSLTLRETRLVIQDGITVGGKTLREHFETLNHNNSIQYIESLINPDYILASKDIKNIHELVLRNIEKEYAGRYRNSGARIVGANFIPPNAYKVELLLDELIQWINLKSSSLDLLIKVCIFHHRFVWIHPFFDGNGITVRLVSNLLLMSKGFPPAIILKNDRKKYYNALDQSNRGDYSKLLLITLQAIERSLDIYLSHISNRDDDYQDISLIAQEPDIPYGAEYISLLARKGRIDAYKDGKNWLTSKDAVLEYIQLRERKRKFK